MRLRTWRGRIWAARLGLLALALNALVPIHLAFDIAEVFEAPQCSAHAEADNAERRLLALLSGHRDANGKSDEHGKHHACPVCSALGALAGFVPTASTALSTPAPAELPTAHFLVQTERFGAPAAYRSRAPPLT
jgi:Protein of unknown function (DUF2946)